jgi:hypothetical protein
MMREAVTVMDRARRDHSAFIEADLDFHPALAEAADHPAILSLILLREQRMRIFKVDGGPERCQSPLKCILGAPSVMTRRRCVKKCGRTWHRSEKILKSPRQGNRHV